MGSSLFLSARRIFSCGIQDLFTVACQLLVVSSSLTRDWIWAPCIESSESQPLDHQGSPSNSSRRLSRRDHSQSHSMKPPSPRYQNQTKTLPREEKYQLKRANSGLWWLSTAPVTVCSSIQKYISKWIVCIKALPSLTELCGSSNLIGCPGLLATGLTFLRNKQSVVHGGFHPL